MTMMVKRLEPAESSGTNLVDVSTTSTFQPSLYIPSHLIIQHERDPIHAKGRAQQHLRRVQAGPQPTRPEQAGPRCRYRGRATGVPLHRSKHVAAGHGPIQGAVGPQRAAGASTRHGDHQGPVCHVGQGTGCAVQVQAVEGRSIALQAQAGRSWAVPIPNACFDEQHSRNAQVELVERRPGGRRKQRTSDKAVKVTMSVAKG